jgi:hypothetical protein
MQLFASKAFDLLSAGTERPAMVAPVRRLSFVRWRRESVLDVYQFMLGLFLFLSPWLFVYARKLSEVDAWASGLAVVLISIAAILAFTEWEEWLNLLLGFWLMLAPWILGFAHTAAYVSIGVGIAIAYVALLDIWWIHYSTDTNATAPSNRTGYR